MASDRTIRFPRSVPGRQDSLPKTLADSFSSEVRGRGMDYFLSGRVVITRGTPRAVAGRVRGSRPYNVTLDYEHGVLSVECECPFFEEVGACKHIWATLLAADQQTFLSAAAADPTVVLDDGTDDFGDPEDFEDEFWDDFPPRPRQVSSWPGRTTQPKRTTASTRTTQPGHPPEPRRLDWKRHVGEITRSAETTPAPYFRDRQVWPEKRHIRYWVDSASTKTSGRIVLNLETRDRKMDGTFSRAVPLRLKRAQIGELPRIEDRDAIAALAGSRQHYSFSLDHGYDEVPQSARLTPELARTVLPLILGTGQCFLRQTREPPSATELSEPVPLRWDGGNASGDWRLALEVRRTPQGWGVAGVLRRGDERMELAVPELITAGGFVFLPDKVAPLEKSTPFDWLMWLRLHGMLEAPDRERDELLAYLLCTPDLPKVEIPEELAFEEANEKPHPRLRFRRLTAGAGGAARLHADVAFSYAGKEFSEREKRSAIFDAEHRRLVRRDPAAEQEALQLLCETGMRFKSSATGGTTDAWELAPTKLPAVVRMLTAAGWSVEAEGKTFRAAAQFSLKVSSGLDWFDLEGGVDYGGQSAELPALLAALRRGESIVRLDDGSYGLLPEDWLKRVAMFAGMGTAQDGSVRFRPSQAGLLDALLLAQPEASCDETFERARTELRNFAGIQPVDQPPGFQGQLRDYQREGLGWIEFLRRFSFGGCLADDMGTGKTAQVLAALEMRREFHAAGGKKQKSPSLVVVPRSLIFNWKEEIARFAPKLKVLDYTGPERDAALIPNHNVVLTTYGTLRRDIAALRDIVFDYAVLDEAQMVKNSGTEGAKAVRLIQAGHRLALSGTPVENHLGELWSLFEFLNPGMLGAAGVFKMAGAVGRDPDEGTRQMLAQALRPFILRRTKAQVARELPARTEQTIYCELDAPQRKLYNELRDHYRDSLLARIQTQGLGKSKIMVLEALLRLRQAACHPGLIDKKRKGESSAKLDSLVENLREVLESGHKALVFSQFTSLLAIVRERLDELGIVYEYLDGKTKDRQARVERFQNDAACQLFLISLKAGGLGLNLTAADYVFLMDPWWNPAVEAQAIDRAHRIGQMRQVSAYRLIARDTVEEKVLELQKTKRDLAAAIIGESNSVLRDLKKEDLELLLS